MSWRGEADRSVIPWGVRKRFKYTTTEYSIQFAGEISELSTENDAMMMPYRPRMFSLGPYVRWTMRLLDDTFLGRCVSWTIRSLDDVSFGRYVPWTMCLLDDTFLGRCVSWTIRSSDDMSLGRCVS
jgi:hypothetical protein